MTPQRSSRPQPSGPSNLRLDAGASKAKPKPERYYPIRRNEAYALRDAAVALDVPEGDLRRAILLEDLPAMEVPDDRQYVLLGSTLRVYVQAVRPEETCRFDPGDDAVWGKSLCAILPLLALITFGLIVVATSQPQDQCRIHHSAPMFTAPSNPDPPLTDQTVGVGMRKHCVCGKPRNQTPRAQPHCPESVSERLAPCPPP